MRHSKQPTRYLAQKENPDCFAFYGRGGDEGYTCFFCQQALRTWLNQK